MSAPTAESDSGERSRQAAPLWAAPLAAIVLLLLGWRAVTELPTYGLDPSWQAGLHMAAHQDLRWGSELLFTFGPLGWLRDPTYWYEDSGRLAVAWLAGTRLITFGVLWTLGRRTFGSWGALLVMLPIAWMINDPVQVLGAAGALWLAWNVQQHPQQRSNALVAAALGALAALELLGKFNVGVLIGTATIVAVAFATPRMRAARLISMVVLAGVSALFVGWLLSGQRLEDLVPYLRGGLEIASGYSAAMGVADPDYSWTVAFTALWWLLGVAAVLTRTDARSRRSRAALIAVWTVISFFLFKAGVVRLDSGHWFIPLATLAPLTLALPWRPTQAARIAAAALALAPVALFAFRVDSPLGPLDVVGHQNMARKQLAGLYDAGRGASLRDLGRADTPAAYGLSPRIVEALRGRSAEVWPWATGIVWGLELEWRPQPIFQTYAAYTARFDQLNRDQVAAGDAAERVLLAPNSSIDSRLASFDTPAAARELVCRYRPVAQQDALWLVVARGANRCSAPRLLTQMTVAWGQPFPVPAPHRDGLVYMRVEGTEAHGLERLRTMLYRGHDRTIHMDDRPTNNRFVAATASQGLPISSGKNADFPAPFAMAPDATTVTLNRAGRLGAGRNLRVAFYELRLRRPKP